MEAGVEMVTAFAFSTENWKRDAHEVSLYTCECSTGSQPSSSETTGVLRTSQRRFLYDGSARKLSDMNDVVRTST